MISISIRSNIIMIRWWQLNHVFWFLNRRNDSFLFPGDRATITIKGKVLWGVVVGLKQMQRPFEACFDSNNIVITQRDGTPIGTRILVPIPFKIRKFANMPCKSHNIEYSKIIAIATKFVWLWSMLEAHFFQCVYKIFSFYFDFFLTIPMYVVQELL